MNKLRGMVSLGLLVLAAFGIVELFAAPLAYADCGGVSTAIISCGSGSNPIIEVIKMVLQILTGLVGIAAVGALIFAGIMYSSASGEQSQVQKAKTMIQNTVIGIVLYGGMFILGNWLVPGGVFGGDITYTPVDNSSTGSGSTGGSDSSANTEDVTIASWNVLRFDNTRANMYAGINEIFSNGASSIGLQEVGAPSFTNTELDSLPSTIGVYKPKDGNTGIVWQNGKYKALSTSSAQMSGDGKWIAIVKLQDIKTQASYYHVDVHMQVGANDEPEGCSTTECKTYKAEINQIKDLLTKLKSDKLPIFLTGDFNMNYRNDKACTITWHPCYALKKIDFQSSYTALNLSGIASSASSINSGSQLIDYVFYWKPQATASSNKILGPNDPCTTKNGQTHCWHNSDHKPLLFTAKIGGGTNTASGGSSSTITKLDGVSNFRDAGASGYIKTGVLYRSGMLHNLSADGAKQLSSLLTKNGVIIDLRTTAVRSSQPDANVTGVSNKSYPINSAESAAEYVKEFVNDATDRKNFGRAITEIAGTSGSVLVHCTQGKDRTGWLVAMIMYSVGANDSQVLTEYLKSNDAGATVKQEWLNAALKAARDKNGGSILTYIKSKDNGLGVSDATITALKQKFGK